MAEGQAEVYNKTFTERMRSSADLSAISRLVGGPGAVAVFDFAAFLTVHNEAALLVAEIEHMPAEAVRTREFSGETLRTLTISRDLYSRLVGVLLMERGLVINEYAKDGNSWVLARTGSPGDLTSFESECSGHPLFVAAADAATTYVAAKRLKIGYSVGIFSIRHLSATVSLLEIPCDQSRLARTAAALTQLATRELYIIDTENEVTAALRQTLAAGTIAVQALPSAGPLPAPAAGLSAVNRALRAPLPTDFSVTMTPTALTAAAFALARAPVPPASLVFKRMSLRDHLQLLPQDLHALHVLPAPGQPDSLLHHADVTVSAAGSRLLASWVRCPLTSGEMIRARQSVVTCLVDDTGARNGIRRLLRNMPPIDLLANRLRKGPTLRELVGVYQAVVRLGDLTSILRRAGESAAGLATRAAGTHEQLHNYRQLIEQTIDPDTLESGSILISPTVCPPLRETAAELARVRATREAELVAAQDLTRLGKKLSTDENATLGWVLRAPKSAESDIRRHSRFEVLEVRANTGVRFTTRELRAASDRHAALTEEYQTLQAQMAEQMVAVAQTFADLVDEAASVLAEADVLAGFAEIAATRDYVPPTILPQDGGARVAIVGGRHPLLDDRLGESFVPQTVVLDATGAAGAGAGAEAGAARPYPTGATNDDDYSPHSGDSQALIITGANCSGKSTVLRLVGANVILAQIGSWVPAQSMELRPFGHILTRVGAEDNVARALSTFMLEMVETASILDTAGPTSLVLIDELGRGTSSADGLAIATAVAEAIIDRGSLLLFATHYHGLAGLTSGARAGVRAVHTAATADPATGRLQIHYELREGAVSHSFGVECAAAMGLPEKVVADAKAELELSRRAGELRGRSVQGDHALELLREFAAAVDSETRETVRNKIRRALGVE